MKLGGILNSLAPIVLFVYNRPDHTKKTLQSLQKNALACESELFIYSDAAKNDAVQSQVDEVRRCISEISGFKKVTVIKQEKNLGLADSIISGVTEIVNKYGKIIVLEDDLVTSVHFLTFMNDALKIYENEHNVFGVTGYAYPLNHEGLPSTFFLKDEGCWSWATWSRSWKYFEKDTDNLLKCFDENMIKDFNFDNSTNFWSQVIKNKEGKINTWAIYWYASIYINNGLFLHPSKSFTKNIGHDGSGVHCGDSKSFNINLIDEYDIVFNKKIEVSIKARARHIDYFNSLKVSFSKRAINKILRIIRGKVK